MRARSAGYQKIMTKTPADSGAQRKTADVPPAEAGEGRLPRDAADPELTDEQQRSRIGSAGGGPYGPGAPREP
jgi:hypothetical protein